jgi:hypothetical protein
MYDNLPQGQSRGQACEINLREGMYVVEELTCP